MTGRGRFYEEAGAIRDVVQIDCSRRCASCHEAPIGGDADASVTRRSRCSVARGPSTPRTWCAGGSAATVRRRGWPPTRAWRRSWPSSRDPFLALGRSAILHPGREVPARHGHRGLGEAPASPEIYTHIPTGQSNYLRSRVHPELVIAVGTRILGPMSGLAGENVELVAHHQQRAEDMDAYERLLGEAMEGNATLFARQDEVEAAWRVVDPVPGNSTPRTSTIRAPGARPTGTGSSRGATAGTVLPGRPSGDHRSAMLLDGQLARAPRSTTPAASG